MPFERAQVAHRGFDPAMASHIALAAERGLGTTCLDGIQVTGDVVGVKAVTVFPDNGRRGLPTRFLSRMTTKPRLRPSTVGRRRPTCH